MKKETECIIWPHYIDKKGYGRKGYGVMAHRFAFEEAGGTLIKGMDIDHTCRVRSCVNPKHLQQVTHAENMRRLAASIVKCKHGHDYTLENTYIQPKGTKACRKCIRIAVDNFKKRRAL